MKESKIFRAISYFLLPIIILIFIMSSVACVSLFSYNYSSKDEYFQSDEFYNRIESSFTNIADRLIFAKEKNYNVYYDGHYKIFKDMMEVGTLYEIENVKFLAVYENKVLTNLEVESKDLETLILEMQSLYENHKYVQYVNNEIDSNSNTLMDFLKNDIGFMRSYTIDYYTIEDSNENTRVEEFFDHESEYWIEEDVIEESINTDNVSVSEVYHGENKIYKSASLDEFNIYLVYDDEFVPESDMNFVLSLLKIINPYKTAICITVPVTLVLMVVLIVVLINSIGYKKGVEGIALNDFDKIPFEILLIVFLTCLGICLAIADILIFDSSDTSLETMLILFLSFYAINITIFEIVAVSMIKRLKAKTFIRTCLCGRIIMFLWNIFKKVLIKVRSIINNFVKRITYNSNLTVKFLSLAISLLIVMVILGATLGGIGLIIDVLIFDYFVFWFFLRIQSFKKFEEALKKVSEGTLEEKLEKRDYSLEFGNSVNYLNNISNGFKTAIEERLKSERMKTELITNVSHDIKTPLTSIISYVDLLKKENIENEKAEEYLEILDSKSQRLKRLTEDLVEASKASSGNLKLELKQINIVELINQAIGEFEDKFKDKKLEIITKFDKPTINIKADSRYMYRVIDNLFSNISKYALESSRVYIDVENKNKDVLISIKNISKERLNITEEELMQRFVRGDKSRTTEGSGLGLAIARSLVSLQGGNLECKIDGDLFKIEITMQWI